MSIAAAAALSGEDAAGLGAAEMTRRRPRDRKQQIHRAAAAQFWARGYHQVGMADIAASVGIAASALYRHYRSKQDLLVEILNEGLDQLGDHGDGGDQGATPLDRTQWIARMAHVALQRREFAALWSRESGHLPPVEREALLGRQRLVLAWTTACLQRGTTGGEDVADLRARAVLAVLSSPSFHRAELEPARFEAMLCKAAAAVADAPLSGADPQPGGRLTGGRDPQQPVSRREALLAAAVRLFADRGYAAVSLTDVGAGAGITGPSVYSHFQSKHDLLVAALNRGNEALWLALQHALADADGPVDALYKTLASYVAFAAVNPDIVSVMLTETVHLPTEQQEHFRRTQHEYVAEWVALMHRCRPGMSDTEVRVLVNATLALPNTLARDPRLRQRPHLTTEMYLFACAVLNVQAARA